MGIIYSLRGYERPPGTREWIFAQPQGIRAKGGGKNSFIIAFIFPWLYESILIFIHFSQLLLSEIIYFTETFIISYN